MSMGRPIGEMQGWWAVSQKVLLMTWPILLAWATWTTQQSFALEKHIDTEKVEARAYTDKCVATALAQVFLELSTIKSQIAALPTVNPPPLWEKFVRDELGELKQRVKELEKKP
jgi:hypothetical protein